MSTQHTFTQRKVGRKQWLAATVAGAVCLGAAPPAQAGALIDLRPTPPMPPGGYAPNTIIDVDVVLVDTGNPDGDIRFTLAVLDFGATSGTFAYPGIDRILGTSDDNQFSWVNPMGFNWVFPSLPRPSWVHPCDFSPCFEFLIMLPDDGETLLGTITVDVGLGGGILDVLNPGGISGGATFFTDGWASFGSWVAARGELTGGRLNVIVPEPASIVLLLAGVCLALSRKRKPRRMHYVDVAI